MDDLSAITGIDNLAIATARSALEEGLVAAAQTMCGIVSGGVEASRTRLDAARWLLEFFLGRGRAAEGTRQRATGDWESLFNTIANGNAEGPNDNG